MSWTTLVASGAFVARDGELLLIRQRRPYGVHWEVPSGYYDRGEALEETARREVRAVLDRWWPERNTGFHLYADVTVRPDGTQAYSFR